ncbi:MAG TPA: hypothetical protein VFC10_19635 [Terriglobia bacterium]|jgi:hypothetical protein|nr:hypothetical protein [Terriglobia bacterium]
MLRTTFFNQCAAIIAGTIVAAATTFGSPAPVGWLLGSRNATLDGQAALPHTAVLNGDNLQVSDGLAMLTLQQGNRMVAGRDTEASFLQEGQAVTVSLTRGTVSLYHPASSGAFQVKAGDVTVAPAGNGPALGEIAMVNGLVLVTAKDGALKVEKAGVAQEVSKGKTVTVQSSAAPEPLPQGKRHMKHIFKLSPEALLILGLAAEAGGTAWAIEAATTSGKPASPVVP